MALVDLFPWSLNRFLGSARLLSNSGRLFDDVALQEKELTKEVSEQASHPFLHLDLSSMTCDVSSCECTDMQA